MKKLILLLVLAFATTATAQVEQEILAQTRAYQFAAAITPSDSTDLPQVTKAIYIGTATAGQTIKVDMERGGTVTLSNVAQGTILKIAAKRVYTTGTTATNLISFY
jgi:hypothetical protein